MKLVIKSRSGRPILPGDGTVTVDDKDTVLDLKRLIAASKRKYYPARQRLSTQSAKDDKPVVLKDSATLGQCGLADGDTILFKDLGPQIGYATVFFFEYFGPLVIYPAFFFFPQLFYPSYQIPKHHALAQQVALAFWTVHYVKRIFETFFVHQFNHATMPLRNLFKNCGYYWAFGAFVAYFVNHPLYTPPSELQTVVAFAAAFGFMASNFVCHKILAGLRGSGATGYSIPRGFLFNYITCANYFAEIWSWICFTIGTQCIAGLFFVLAGSAQMSIWAAGKHRRLNKLFDGKEGREKYPKRYIMFPPFF